jgi:hypothetical protein
MLRIICIAALGIGLLLYATQTQAAIGLKCSEWLDARAYIRYDARTNQFIDTRPKTVAPVREEIDSKVAWAQWYLSGRITTLMLLDVNLAKIGASVGVEWERSRPDLLAALAGIDELCRGGLLKDQRDYDVAEIMDLQTAALVTERALKVTTMLENSMQAGRRLGAQGR